MLLAGKSYEGGAALFTLAQHHPAVAGAFLENAFWCAPGRWRLLIDHPQCQSKRVSVTAALAGLMKSFAAWRPLRGCALNVWVDVCVKRVAHLPQGHVLGPGGAWRHRQPRLCGRLGLLVPRDGPEQPGAAAQAHPLWHHADRQVGAACCPPSVWQRLAIIRGFDTLRSTSVCECGEALWPMLHGTPDCLAIVSADAV